MRPGGEGVFLGPRDAPLAGRLHGPADGQVTAAVLIAPPLGFDAVSAHVALRTTAISLAERGLLVLRLDYHGTGDSPGSAGDPHRVAAWSESIRVAIGELRALTGQPVFVVGVSIGGLLAAGIGGSDGILLWEPPSNGRVWLREQHALARVAGLAPAGSALAGVETAGYVYDAQTVADLGRLVLGTSLPEAADYPRTVLAEYDEDLLTTAAHTDTHTDVDPGTAVRTVVPPEPNGFLGVSPVLARLPTRTLSLIVSTITGWAAGAGAVHVTASWPTEATVGSTPDGRGIVERHLSLGEHGLPAILTEVPADADAGLPAVVFLPTGNEHCLGPGRSWVQLSRSWAGDGRRSLRVDLRSVGELIDETSSTIGYPTTAMPDVAAALSSVRTAGAEKIVVVGLCSGAFHAIEAGLSLEVDAVGAINPVTNMTDVLRLDEAGAERPANPASVGPPGWASRLAGSRLLQLLEPRIPFLIWTLLDRLGLIRLPTAPLRELAGRDRRTLLLCGEEEVEPYRTRAGPELDRLVAGGTLTLRVVADSSHAMLDTAGRAQMQAAVDEFVRSC